MLRMERDHYVHYDIHYNESQQTIKGPLYLHMNATVIIICFYFHLGLHIFPCKCFSDGLTERNCIKILEKKIIVGEQ